MVDRNTFCIARREYKHLLTRKRKEHDTRMINLLVSSVDDQSKFWETVHKIASKRTHVKNDITLENWFQHFRVLLEQNDTHDNSYITSEIEEESVTYAYNRPISREEVLLAFKKLKSGKAAGPEGIKAEVLKYSCDQVIDFL